ncbi:uncharacterized protein J8A68_001696 [[Candida] subhashii]|uniref:Actin patches distal protein 1 n=1 Tax=[Candida] subhashii TaxID=561895 RepID=A0A8J5UQG6_9ASCO|nr:uncharacterized protein J8A68_001696 [[Candida] subhashii]KAG7664741.1 hypothetical protein J8A68_001696 [[Candida] subhashii]
MTILHKLLGLPSNPNPEREITKAGFEVSTCSSTCDGCTSGSFPKSVKFEENAPLWESTKPYGLHIVVYTGKTDWPHDATSVKGTLSHEIAKWADKTKSPLGKIKVTCSSLGSDELLTEDDYINETKGDILLLPHFLSIKGLTIQQVDPILTSLTQQLADPDTYPIDSILSQFPQVQKDNNMAYVFFCSHRTRDKRCGITAPIMQKEMNMYLQELGLYRDFGDLTPGGVNVAFVNHVGGHKFGANVIIYLKRSGKNIWLGLCRPENVKPIVDECILKDGRVWPEKVRMVQKFDPIDW